MGSPTYDFQSRIIIDIRDDVARRRLAATSRQARRAGGSFDYASRRGGIFRRTVNTITKALTSMIGVLIAFSLLITGPQFALNLLRRGFQFAIEAVAEFEQRILGIQAILASLVTFDPDPASNFAAAGLVAENVIGQLADRAAEMVGSLEEGALVFQTLLSTGAHRLVQNVDELVDLSILLSNTIAGITVGQDRQRQLAEETRSLFTGQIRATSLLARLLFKNRREMELFFDAAAESGDLVERLTERLAGFTAASEDFARTFEGVRSSLLTIVQVIFHRALGGTGGVLGDLFDQLAAIAKAVQEDDERFTLLTASVSASAQVISDYAREIFGLNKYLNDSGTILDLIISLVPPFTQGIVYLIALFRSLGLAAKAAYQALDILLSAIGRVFRLLRNFNIISGIIGILRLTLNVFLGLVDTVLSIINIFQSEDDKINRFGRNLERISDQLNLGIKAVDETSAAYDQFVAAGSVQDLTDQFNALLDTLDQLGSGTAAIEFAEDALARFRDILPASLQRILDNLQKLREAQNQLNVASTLDLKNIIEKNKELLRTVSLTRRQARAVRSVLDAASEGLIPRDIVRQIAGQVDTIASSVRRRIQQVADQLRLSEVQLLEAQLTPEFLEDPDQLVVLEDQIISLRGEISALAAELAALDRVTLSFANTTLQDLSDTLGNLIKTNVFDFILQQFRDLRDELEDPLGIEDLAKDVVEGLGVIESVEAVADRLSLSLGDLVQRIVDFVKSAEGLTEIVAAVGNVVAAAFTSALQGVSSFGEFLKAALGAVLITLGQAMLSSGIALLIASIFNPGLIASALALIAGGAGVIAAGVALSPQSAAGSSGTSGAGAGATPEFAFTQQQIATQQHFSEATESLRVSSDNMNQATQNLNGVQPGELFMRGSEQAGGVTRVLAQDARRSDRFSSTREAARAFQGS